MLTLNQAADEMREADEALERLLSEHGLSDLSEPTRAVFEEMQTRADELGRALQAGDVETVRELVPEAEEAARCVEAALAADQGAVDGIRDQVLEVHRILMDLRGQVAL